MSKVKFNSFVSYHRKLMEKGLVEYPTYFKKEDLYRFDKASAEYKAQLIKENKLETWEVPSSYCLKHPKDFFFVNEATMEKVPENVQGALRSQINVAKRLRTFYDRLEDTEKLNVNGFTEENTKSGLNFEKELDVIETEINNLYKGPSGWFQRGMAKFKDAGRISTGTVRESKPVNEILGTIAAGGIAGIAAGIGSAISGAALEKRKQRLIDLLKIAKEAISTYKIDPGKLTPAGTTPPAPEPEKTQLSINSGSNSLTSYLTSMVDSSSLSEPDKQKLKRTVFPLLLIAVKRDLEKTTKFIVKESTDEPIDMAITSTLITNKTESDDIKAPMADAIKKQIKTWFNAHGLTVNLA